jgi:outer membrane protein assembly factor BamA
MGLANRKDLATQEICLIKLALVLVMMVLGFSISALGSNQRDKNTPAFVDEQMSIKRIHSALPYLGRIHEVEVLSPNPRIKSLLERHLRPLIGKDPAKENFDALRAQLNSILTRNGFWLSTVESLTVLSARRNQIDSSLGALKSSEAKVQDFSIRAEIQGEMEYFVRIVGNSKIRTSTLRNALDLENFSTQNLQFHQDLASRLRNFYRTQGFMGVEVSSRIVPTKNAFRSEVEIRIREGSPTKIKHIRFFGELQERSEWYTREFYRHAVDPISSKRFVREAFEQSLELMIQGRWDAGFIRSRVNSRSYEFSPDRSSVQIEIGLSESGPTILETVSLNGNTVLSDIDLLNVMNLNIGRPFKVKDFENSLQRLTDHYQSLGFLDFEILNTHSTLVRYSQDLSTVQLQFEIYEGPIIKVGEIKLQTESFTQTSVILKELEFSSGEILTPEKMKESVRRLERTGFFSAVEIRIEQSEPARHRTQKASSQLTSPEAKQKREPLIEPRTVVVEVQDRNPGSLNLGIGMTNERGSTLRGFAGLSYRNLFGTGRGLSGRIEGNYNTSEIRYFERQITTSYQEPYIFNTRTRGRVSLTNSILVSTLDSSASQATEVNQLTGTLEQDITSRLQLSWDVYSIATVQDFNFKTGETLSSLNIGSTLFSFLYDKKNHPTLTTSGYVTRWSAEYGSPSLGSSQDIEYLRGINLTQFYIPIAREGMIHLAHSFRSGLLQNLSDGRGVPFDKKGFILGGTTTVRGFNYNEAFPSGNDLGSGLFRIDDRATMLMFKSELRFPIWEPLGGGVFYDGGQVSIRNQPNNRAQNARPIEEWDSTWRDSVGISARYLTPVGAVSGDVGWKLRADASRNEDPWVFHFSIGTF